MKSPTPGPVAECVALFREGHHEILIYRAWSLRVAELAELLTSIKATERLRLAQVLPPRLLAQGLTALHPSAATALLTGLPADHSTPVLDALEPRTAAILLDHLSAKERNTLLGRIEKRELIDQVLSYRPGSVGRGMQLSLILVTGTDSVGLALEGVRRQASDQGNTAEIYVVDVSRRLIGRLSFRDLAVAPRNAQVREVMQPVIESVAPEWPFSQASDLMLRYSLAALPVVDPQQRPLGWVGAQGDPLTSARDPSRMVVWLMLAFAGMLLLLGLAFFLIASSR